MIIAYLLVNTVCGISHELFATQLAGEFIYYFQLISNRLECFSEQFGPPRLEVLQCCPGSPWTIALPFFSISDLALSACSAFPRRNVCGICLHLSVALSCIILSNSTLA